MDALITSLPYHNERNRVYWQGGEEFSQSTASNEVSSQEELIP
jgi:hypothetical protein